MSVLNQCANRKTQQPKPVVVSKSAPGIAAGRMRAVVTVLSLLAIASALLSVETCLAQDDAVQSGEATQEGDPGPWVSMFNGKSLEGWTQKNGWAAYRVEDDAIVGTTSKGSPNSFLCSVQEYGDFELEFEVMCDSRLNSGVQIRSATAGDQSNPYQVGRVNGPQVEIEASGDNGAEAGYIYGEAAGGWLVAKEDRTPTKVFKDGEWNHYRIVALGNRIQTFINGEAVCDLVHPQSFETHPSGFIGLQVHGVGQQGPFEVRWRKLRIRELK